MKALILAALLLPLNSVSAETHNRGYLYLDIGILGGSLDPMDHVLDLNEKCDDEIQITGRNLVDLVVKESSARDQWKGAGQVMEEFGYQLESGSDRFDENFVIPAYGNHGSETTFILLPEIHSYALPEAFRTKNAMMEFKRTLLALGWMEKNKGQILNLKEGPQGFGLPMLKEFTPSGDAFADAYNIAGHTPFVSLLNIYKDSPRLYSTNTESFFNVVLQALVMSGYKHGSSYEDTLAFLAKSGFPLKSAARAEMHKVWETLHSWSLQQYEAATKTICEDRSHSIAEKALSLAQEKRSNLIFLTFGASHSGGIIKHLERRKVNYILVLANTKAL